MHLNVCVLCFFSSSRVLHTRSRRGEGRGDDWPEFVGDEGAFGSLGRSLPLAAPRSNLNAQNVKGYEQ